MTPIFVVRYRMPELEQRCIEELRQHTPSGSYRLIVYDNDPENEALSVVWNRMILGHPSKVHDEADRQAIAEWSQEDDPIFCLLNTDCFVRPGWLEKLRETFVANQRIGFAGPMTDNCGSVQKVTHPYWSPIARFRLGKPEHYDGQVLLDQHISGFCMLIRRQAWIDAGTFDESFPFYGEESALIVRGQQAGWRTAIRMDVFVEHLGGATFQAAEERGETSWEDRKEAGRKRYREFIGNLRRPPDPPFDLI